MKLRTAFALLSAMSLTLGAAAQTSVGTAFTYQGKLTSGAAPYTGTADLVFQLFDREAGGTPLATRTLPNVPVALGIFTVDLDFGSEVFKDGQERWLQIRVNTILLDGRQRVAPTPYSIATRGITVDAIENVGIGVSAPDGRLHVGQGSQVWTRGGWAKGLRLDGFNAVELGGGHPLKYGVGASQGILYLFSTPGEGADADINYRVVVAESGSVGVGTVNPAAQLHVRRDVPDNENLLELSFEGGNVGSTGEEAALLRIHSNSIFRPLVSLKAGEVLVDAQGNLTSGHAMYVGYAAPSGNSGFVSIGQSGGEYGSIGHGFGFTDTNHTHLYRFNDFASRVTFDRGGFQFLTAPSGTVGQPVLWTEVMIVKRDGRVGIGTTEPQHPLHVVGVTRTSVLEITGGSDLAEPFDVTSEEEVLPGTVLVIDPDHDGRLVPCSTSYDTSVAGVVSGAKGLSPGMVMKAEGSGLAEGEHPVAMTGRVWVRCDASHGAIRRGDRLTTSATPGHAMRVGDSTLADGAVIGKAMSELGSGCGFVLVLVNLQ